MHEIFVVIENDGSIVSKKDYPFLVEDTAGTWRPMPAPSEERARQWAHHLNVNLATSDRLARALEADGC